jgi:hypothetical protein
MENLEDILNQVREVEDTKIKNERGGFTPDPRILKFKTGATYTVRFLFNPAAEGADRIFVDYKEVGFPSRIDGRYIYGGRAPQDAGIKNDQFKAAQWDHFSKAKENGDEAEKKRSYKLIAQRKQMANVYLVDVVGDEEQKQFIGTDMVLKYPAQIDKDGKPSSDLYKKINSAIIGDKSAKIGKKAFLLDDKGKLIANGKDFIIKVTKKSDGAGGFWPNYSESEFDDSDDIKLSPEKIETILKGVHNLREFIPEVKSTEEIKQILDEHWFGNVASLDDELAEHEKAPNIIADVDDTDIPLDSEDDLDKMLKGIK